MSEILIDLYSDTQTRPTPAMRRAMMEAEVGDEQRGEDPSVNALCRTVAALLGKEDALFLPSGTMCNEIAYRVHCEPGDEIILDATGHALHFETGAPGALAGVMTRTLDGEGGIFSAAQLADAVRTPARHHPRSRLVSVENTSNLGGGSVWPIARISEVVDMARGHGLRTHMDGARLLNAVVASGVAARDYAAGFDSAWIDLSKGLGAPVGGVLAGSAAFIERAWRFKHQFGGAMRQAGVLAAAGSYALAHHVERLAEDHDNAARFAAAIRDVPGIVAPDRVDTNIVFFRVDTTVLSAPSLSERLLEHGVRIGAMDESKLRAVTHLDVDRESVDAAASAIRTVVEDLQ